MEGVATGRDLHALFRSVYELHAILEKGLDLVHEQSGMSTPWKRVLHTLARDGQLTVPNIAAKIGVSRQFILKTCNDMAEAGLVKYVENPQHKRSRLVLVTRAGEAAYMESRQREDEIIAKALPGMHGGTTRAATALLEELRRKMIAFGLEGLESV